MTIYLADFRIKRPAFEYTQEETLAWLAGVHARGEASLQNDSFDSIGFEAKLHTLLTRVGLGDGKIKKRGTERLDVGKTYDPDLYSCMGKKTAAFGTTVDQYFEELYPENETLPQQLIHVTCTGYVSPSGAQKLVAKRNAGRQTTVTHAYHMGCYGAIAALRIAKGFVSSKNERTDIVHTELCSLHTNPESHTLEQLVVESLFSDGCIRYSILRSPDFFPALALLVVRETTVPNSSQAMTWQPASWGMQMSLKKEIPGLIAQSIDQTIDDLAVEAGVLSSYLREKAVFAIHPGGTKIIDTIAELLRLQPHQILHTRKILESYGNMSSATLPHIWEALINDDAIAAGTPIVGLAFGPGLTIASSLMEKQICP